MENTSIAIVGGGASGLIAALSLAERGLQDRIAVFERLDRVGKKLIATGNGQGNLYNAEDGAEHYRNGAFARAALARYGAESCAAFYRSLGILPVVRQDGRAYPAGLQASAVLDLMRAKLAWHGVRVETGKRVEKLEKRGKGFLLSFGQEKVYAERVLLAAGGRAAPQFGTDGTAYALAEGLGHTVTKTFPSLVQLTTEREPIRGLKGVKAEGIASVVRGGREAKQARGEILFTDYGVSGDAIFRLSAFLTDKLGGEDVSLSLEFLPGVEEERLCSAADHVVYAHCNTIDTDGIVLVHQHGGYNFRPHAVRAGDKHRLLHAGKLRREQAAKAADPRNNPRNRRPFDMLFHQLHGFIPGGYVNAGFLVALAKTFHSSFPFVGRS